MLPQMSKKGNRFLLLEETSTATNKFVANAVYQ
jgi:hypothetical protein